MDLAEQPAASPHLEPPVLDLETHRATVAAAIAEAERLGKVEPEGPPAITEAPVQEHSLAQWQSAFQDQNNRGTCWAFAGAAALEAAYRRKFNTLIDVSEEYVFHMGKSFALNRTLVGGPVVTPVENSTIIPSQCWDSQSGGTTLASERLLVNSSVWTKLSFVKIGFHFSS